MQEEPTMKRPLFFILLILAFLRLNANERIPIYSSQFLEYYGNGLTLPNGDILFFTNASDEYGNNIVMNRITVIGENVSSESIDITNAPGDEYIINQILSSDGCVIFTYNFLAEDVDHYYDDVMYIQKVTLSGQTLWGEMGKKITRNFTNYTLVPNNLGGAYLLNDGNSYDEAKVYGWNFNAQGNNLWQSDIILEMPCSYLYLINVLADGAGNIILNLMLKDSPESDWYSHLIKLSPEGNIIGNNPLLPQSQFSGLYQIHSDRNGNYVLWKVIDSNLTLQKMDSSYNLLLPQAITYQHSSDSEISNLGFCADGSLYYSEERNYPLNPFIYKLNPDLQPSWTAPAEIPFYYNYYYRTFRIADDNSLYMAYIDYWGSNGNLPNSTIMLTRINSVDGSIAFPFTCVSSQIFPKGAARIFASSDKALVLWYDISDINFEVRCQLVAPSGSILLEQEGRTLQYRQTGSVNNYQVVNLPQGACYVYEITDTCFNFKLYYQICDDNLSPLLGEYGIELNPDSSEAEWLKKIILTPQNQIGILYLTQNAQDVFSLYYQVIDNTGTVLLPGRGILIKEAVTDPNYNYQMTCVDDDIIIAWEEIYSLLITRIIRGQRLHNNLPQWDAGGKILKQSTPYNCNLVNICENYLVYEDYNYTNYSYGIRKLDTDGNPDPSWLLTDYITSGIHSFLMQSCSLMGDEMAVFYIKEFIAGLYARYDLYVQKYNSQGLPLWGTLGILLDTTEGRPISVAGVNYGDKIFFALQKYDPYLYINYMSYNLITNNGTIIWDNPESFTTEMFYETNDFKLIPYNNDVYSILWLSVGSDNLSKINNHYVLSDGSLYYNQAAIIDKSVKSISDLQVLNKGNYCLANYRLNKYYIEYKGAAEGLQSPASNESRELRSTASNPKGFSYEVKSLYAYKIPSEPVFTDDPLQPPATLSCCNYPNPFNPETTISFEIPKTDNVSLQIYNLKGQLIRTLVNDYLPAGKQSIVWNGTDNNNQPVSSGVYLYKIKTGKCTKSAKMLLLK
jgi:hypothetical protein